MSTSGWTDALSSRFSLLAVSTRGNHGPLPSDRSLCAPAPRVARPAPGSVPVRLRMRTLLHNADPWRIASDRAIPWIRRRVGCTPPVAASATSPRMVEPRAPGPVSGAVVCGRTSSRRAPRALPEREPERHRRDGDDTEHGDEPADLAPVDRRAAEHDLRALAVDDRAVG